MHRGGGLKLSVQHFLKWRPKQEKIPLTPPMKPDNWSEFGLVCGKFIIYCKSQLEAAMKMAFVLLEVDVLDQTEPRRH